MSRENKKELKDFLNRDGYLLVFTVVCALSLLSYFLANDSFQKGGESTQVLGTSTVRGVWVKGPTKPTCAESSCLNDYRKLDSKEVALDEYGRVVFSNDRIFVSGIFDRKKMIDSDVWEDVHIGDLNLKINNRQWVFENIVSNREDINSLISIVEVERGNLVVLHPSMTLSGLNKNFWVFEYLDGNDFVRPISFIEEGNRRAFVESTNISFLEKGNELFLKLERLDPALMGNTEIELYRYGDSLELVKSFILESE